MTFVLAILSLTSCSKSGKACGGGGWYGDRNLSFELTEPKKSETTTHTTLAVAPASACE